MTDPLAALIVDPEDEAVALAVSDAVKARMAASKPWLPFGLRVVCSCGWEWSEFFVLSEAEVAAQRHVRACTRRGTLRGSPLSVRIVPHSTRIEPNEAAGVWVGRHP